MMKWVHSFHLSAHRQFIGLCHCVSRLCRHTHTDTYLPLPPSLCYYMNLCMVWNKETAQQNMHFFTHKLNCVCFFIRALLNQSVWKKLNESYTTNGGAITRTHKNSNACHCIGEKMANRQVPFSIIIFIIIIIVIYYEEKKWCVKNSKWRSWSLCAIVSHLIKFNSNLWRFSLRGISNFFSVFHSFSPISLSPNTTNGDSIA